MQPFFPVPSLLLSVLYGSSMNLTFLNKYLILYYTKNTTLSFQIIVLTTIGQAKKKAPSFDCIPCFLFFFLAHLVSLIP